MALHFQLHDRRPFGNTGLSLPPIIFGGTSLGNLFRIVDPAEKTRIVDAWFDQVAPPLVIDSAGKYGAGLSLEVIGRELQRRGVSEDQVIISNKLAWRRVPLATPDPTFEPGAWFGLDHDAIQDISHDGILRCWAEGNALLAPYRASLVSVHDPDEYLAAAKGEDDYKRRTDDIVGAYKALEKLRDDGLVAAVGIGAKDWKSIRYLANYCQFDWVMFANSYTIYSHPRELSDWMQVLAGSGVGIINSALFHGGFLVGGEYFDYRRVDPSLPADAEKLAWRDRFWDVCALHATTPMEAAIAFGRRHPAVHAVAISSSRADRVALHVKSVAQTLPDAFWNALREQGLID
ncbi:MAG: aldo/keto reductase [Planctomycetaceae bacterium]